MGCTALVVVLVVGGGCTSGDGSSSADAAPVGPAELDPTCAGPPPGEPVDITFAHAEGGPRADRIADYVEAFERENPGVHVDVVPVGDGNGAVLEDWRRQSPADRPELMLQPQTANARLIDSGQTVAPGGCIRQVAPDMLDAISRAWSAGGVLQAVPFAVSTPVLLYDRRIFRRAGLDPDRPPTTLDDLRGAAFRAWSSGAADHGLLFDTGPESGASWILEQIPARAGQVAYEPQNGRHGTATSVTWRSGLALGTLEWLAEGTRDGWATSVGQHPLDSLRRALDPATSVAMTFSTCGALGEIYDLLDRDATPDIELDVARLPRPDEGPAFGQGHGSLPGGSALWIAGGKSEAETAAAWALARHLASPEVQADWAVATGSVPISPTAARRPEVRRRWTEHPGMRVAYDVLAEQGRSPEELGPLVGPLGEVHEIEAWAVDEVVRGTEPVDALMVAADDADRLLQAYDRSRPRSPGG
jgi:sn-glycerol 3-phosphate transport system substrate-binding protein